MKSNLDLFDSDGDDDEEEEENEDGQDGDDEEEKEENEENDEKETKNQNSHTKIKVKNKSNDETIPSTQNIINIKEEKNKEKNIDKTLYGVFIMGLPFESTEIELKNLFSKFGEIVRIKLPKYQNTNKNIGHCHIYYNNEESAIKSLNLNGHKLGKRYIEVSLAKPITNHFKENNSIDPYDVPLDCTTAFIKNLSYDTTEKEVNDKFITCGPINAIRFVYDSQNHKFKGFCYIDFKEHKGLLKALKLNGSIFRGRIIKVDYEQGKPKRGKYTNDTGDFIMLNRKRYGD